MLFMHPAAFPAAGRAAAGRRWSRTMMRFNEELAQAGVLLALDGLTQPEDGARVRFAGGRPSVTDGPFTEAKELIGGYWIIQASSKEEAVRVGAPLPRARRRHDRGAPDPARARRRLSGWPRPSPSAPSRPSGGSSPRG